MIANIPKKGFLNYADTQTHKFLELSALILQKNITSDISSLSKGGFS